MKEQEIQTIIKEIEKRKPKTILLQLPEGLKKQALEITQRIEGNTNSKVIVSGNPCWGACDIAETEAIEIGADLIVHIGHSAFVKTSIPVIYIPYEYEEKIVINNSEKNKLKSFKSMTLLSSIQYLSQLENIKKQLPNSKIAKDPQILGCKYPVLTSEAVLVVGSKFHALSVALKNSVPVFVLETDGKITDMQNLKQKILSNKLHNINQFKKAKNIGILISTKPGQKNLKLAREIKEKLELDQREVILISAREITNDLLNNFYNIEAFVNTACPRLSIENMTEFDKPVINSEDILN